MTDSEKLDLILKKVDSLDGKVSSLDEKVNVLDGKVNSLDEKVNVLDGKVNSLDEKVNVLDGKVNSLDTELREVRYEITKIDLAIENEIRVNIQRVAEGHLDLSRKLNECIRLSSDIKDKQEIQDIYINMHDSRLKALV